MPRRQPAAADARRGGGDHGRRSARTARDAAAVAAGYAAWKGRRRGLDSSKEGESSLLRHFEEHTQHNTHAVSMPCIGSCTTHVTCVCVLCTQGGHINGVHTNGLVAHNGLHAPLNGFNGFSHGLPNGLNGQLLATNGLNGLTGWPNGLNGLLPTVLPNGLNGLSLPAMTTLDNNNLNQNGSDGTNGSSDGAGGVTGVHASNGTGSSDANQGNGSDNNNNNNGKHLFSLRMVVATRACCGWACIQFGTVRLVGL